MPIIAEGNEVAEAEAKAEEAMAEEAAEEAEADADGDRETVEGAWAEGLWETAKASA